MKHWQKVDRRWAKQWAANQRAYERLRADYRKLWEMTLGPHPVPTVPATVDDPKVFARLVLADEIARLRAVERYARSVMRLLDEHGPSIVPHLMDNDDNDGERLRRALGDVEDGAS